DCIPRLTRGNPAAARGSATAGVVVAGAAWVVTAAPSARRHGARTPGRALVGAARRSVLGGRRAGGRDGNGGTRAPGTGRARPEVVAPAGRTTRDHRYRRRHGSIGWWGWPRPRVRARDRRCLRGSRRPCCGTRRAPRLRRPTT